MVVLEKVFGVLEEVLMVLDFEKLVDFWELCGYICFDEVMFGYNGEKMIFLNFFFDILVG